MILIEAPSAAYPVVCCVWVTITHTRRRPHALLHHAAPIVLRHRPACPYVVLHRHMKAGPDALLTALAPSRDQIVIAVACVFTWYWLADLCAREGIPCVLGHALYMRAIQGGKAKNDKIDSHKIAVLLHADDGISGFLVPARMHDLQEWIKKRPRQFART